MTGKIRLLIADDHTLLRIGLLALLETTPDIEVVGEAADGVEAVAKTCDLRPDVLLLDLMMPRLDGISVIGAVRRQAPEVKILVLTSFDDDDKVFPAFKAGALGYLLKDTSPGDLLEGIRAVCEGKSFMHPAIAGKVMNDLNRPVFQQPSLDALTDRELGVLKLLAKGMSNQDIAATLVITENTVVKHVSNILIKLHLANRTQLALFAIRQGLIQMSDLDPMTGGS